MKVEIMFPEIANLYGDLQNIEYLKNSSADVEVINDSLTEEPYFVENQPDLIYMGTMSESSQIIVRDKLLPYKDRILELIDNGTHFLITGNGMEIFGTEVREKDNVVLEGLNIFPIISIREMDKRFNSLYLGHFMGAELKPIVGYKSQFTQSYWMTSIQSIEPTEGYMFMTERGTGLNPGILQEGVLKNNFMATYVIGPILVLNPHFTKWLLNDLGEENVKLQYEEDATAAYEVRLKEYSNPDTGFFY